MSSGTVVRRASIFRRTRVLRDDDLPRQARSPIPLAMGEVYRHRCEMDGCRLALLTCTRTKIETAVFGRPAAVQKPICRDGCRLGNFDQHIDLEDFW